MHAVFLARNNVAHAQELYRWPGVVAAARTALGLRYQLLPYLYSAYRRTAGHGCPLARPLFLGWPSDPLARTADRQWLMGDSVLITPVLEEVCAGAAAAPALLPWCSTYGKLLP